MTDEKEKKPEKNISRGDSPDDFSADGHLEGNPGQPPFRMEMDTLLTPISEDRPAGEDLRYEGTYDLIREAIREDDASLPQGVWERDLKKADWQKVRDICIQVLETRSKDLQVSVWLMEALFHLDGFSGVREGLRIITALCKAFWEEMYPSIGEDDDFDARLSPLVWVNEKFFIKLKFEPITHPKSRDVAAYNFADWENANRLEKTAAKDKKAKEDAEKGQKITRAKFLSSVMFTSSAFYRWRHNDLTRALENLSELYAFLEETCGNRGPSLTKFRAVLEEIHELTGSFLKEKREESDEASAQNPADAGMDETETSYGYGKGGEVKSVALSIRNRAEAYRMLSEAADYLFIHEPHSPTPYLVKRAVSWGNMTLTELLHELVADEQDRKLIFNLLGIKM